MKNIVQKTRHFGALTICLAIFLMMAAFLLPLGGFFKNNKDGDVLTAVAETSEYIPSSIEIQQYDIKMHVQSDRKVLVEEKITVEFLSYGLSMFYRTLPKEGTRYYDVKASCEGNTAFYYNVKENPDMDGFLDVNCIGGAQKGNVWTYDISYTMESGKDFGDGIIIDVVGFGWPVELHNVTATVFLPDSPIAKPSIYVGAYKEEDSHIEVSVSNQNNWQVIMMSAECLPLRLNETYYERMATGITLKCEFEKGVFVDFQKSRIWTPSMPWIILGGLFCLAASVGVVVVFRKKREVISVVSVSPPDGMDPMKMGVLLDGAVDTEDVTSMIYYFADQGYLNIDFEDDDDPMLIKVKELPSNAPAYQKTLFNGLFKSGDNVRTSKLAQRYYSSVQKAKLQIPKPKLYETKSCVGFALGGMLGVLYMTLTLFLMGILHIGGGYKYLLGVSMFVPVFVVLFLSILRENYRYKWNQGMTIMVRGIQCIVIAVAGLIFVSSVATHIVTQAEMLALYVFTVVSALVASLSLTRNEEHVKQLGDILGFKEFILYTEEDRLKEMLNEMPQLFYAVLPYAQVLGVSNIWEEKFANLTLEPPSWCVGYRMTIFDYMIINRCMRRAFATAMQPPQNSSAGRSGGGGSFGGFSGGGFGGGGGGAR